MNCFPYLGLTALRASEIHKLMREDYPEKFKAYEEAATEKIKEELRAEVDKVAQYKAFKSAQDKQRRIEERERREKEMEWYQLNDDGSVNSYRVHTQLKIH